MVPYERSAIAYDTLHEVRGLDYPGASAAIEKIVRSRNPSARSLLDVACGTGRHLEHFRGALDDVEGIDLAEGMAQVAERRLPGVPIHRGDMRSFDLRRRFDVVTCLFSSIGYLLTDDDLASSLRCMARHLMPDGVLVIEPWLHAETWRGDSVRAECGQVGEASVSRVTRAWSDGRLTHTEMHWSFGTVDGVESFVEHHVLAMRSIDEYVSAFRAAGLDVAHDPVGPTGRGMFVATRA